MNEMMKSVLVVSRHMPGTSLTLTWKREVSFSGFSTTHQRNKRRLRHCLSGDIFTHLCTDSICWRRLPPHAQGLCPTADMAGYYTYYTLHLAATPKYATTSSMRNLVAASTQA